MSSIEELPDDELWALSTRADQSERADALFELAERAAKRKDWNIAKNLYGSASDLFIELEKEFEASLASHRVGICHYHLNEFDDAIASLSAALARGREFNDSKIIAYSSGPLGDSLAAVHRYEEAIEVYRLAVDACYELEEFTLAGISALDLGEIDGQHGRQSAALEWFIKAFNIFQRGGDAIGSGRAKDRMASALIELGDLERALGCIRDALDIFTFIENEWRAVHMKYRLGWTLNLLERYIQAEEPLREAIATYRAHEQWSNAANVELQLAISLIFRDLTADHSVADVLLRKLSAYYDATGEQSNVSLVLGVKGDRLMGQGSFWEAANIWRTVLARAKEYGDAFLERQAKLKLAECLFHVGQKKEAKKLFSSIDPADWGENKPELDRLERVRGLLHPALADAETQGA